MGERHRQRDTKRRAAIRDAGDVDAAFVGVDDLADNGKAQTRSLRLGRKKRIEHLVGHFARHTRARVADFDDHRRHGGVAIEQQGTLVGRGDQTCAQRDRAPP